MCFCLLVAYAVCSLFSGCLTFLSCLLLCFFVGRQLTGFPFVGLRSDMFSLCLLLYCSYGRSAFCCLFVACYRVVFGVLLVIVDFLIISLDCLLLFPLCCLCYCVISGCYINFVFDGPALMLFFHAQFSLFLCAGSYLARFFRLARVSHSPCVGLFLVSLMFHSSDHCLVRFTLNVH